MPAQYGSKWSTSGPQATEDVPLPSGETVLARRPGVQGLIKAGVINELDALTGLVDLKHNQRVNPSKKAKTKGAKPQDFTGAQMSNEEIKSLLSDTDKLDQILRVAGRVAAYCVVRPSLRLHWRESEDPRDGKVISLDLTEEERVEIIVDIKAKSPFPEDPVLFTDEVDMEDLMFLMNFAVGGTRDLAQFRAELHESVAGVVALQDVPLPTE